MPVDKSIKMAVEPVQYHIDYVSRCAWVKLPAQEVQGYDWWIVTYRGQAFAEMWIGKSGTVYGLLYTKNRQTGISTGRIITDKNMRVVEMAIVGALFNGNS